MPFIAEVVTFPQVSIVLPAYNAEATVGRALRSLRAQTISTWEAIVVDDGSQDGTLTVAREWARTDSRIHAYTQPNGGASAARNTGIERARGKWIVFLDSDDTLHPRYLALMSRAAAKDSTIGAVCCGYVRIGTDGRKTAVYRAPEMDPDPFLACVNGPPSAIHGFMVQRQIIQDIGCFDTSLSTNEDWDLWIRVARAGTVFATVRKSLANYWESNSSSLTKFRRQMTRDAHTVIQRLRSMDPRVLKPAACHAGGAELGDPMVQLLSCAIWNAGALIGKGLDGCVLLDEIAPSSSLAVAASGMSAALLDGVMIGAQCRLDDLLEIWPRLQHRLEVFLEAVAAKMCDRSLKDVLLRALEINMLSVSDFRQDVRLAFVQGIVLTPRIMVRGFAPESTTDLVVFKLPMSCRWRIFRSPLVVFGPLSGSELRALIRRRFLAKLLKKLSENQPFATSLLWRLTRALKRGTSGILKCSAKALPLSETLVPKSFLPQIMSITHEVELAVIASRTHHVPPAAERPIAIKPDGIPHAYSVPVLAYPCIARDGSERQAMYRLDPVRLEHQLRFMRRRGFQSISPDDWMKTSENFGFLGGRVVVLTFYGYRDFDEVAWPLIVRNGFTAHVFVPTANAGESGNSHGNFDEPSVMSWNQISRLAREGATFGSCFQSAADLLSSAALLREAISSRIHLRAATGKEVGTVALRFGAMDVRTEQILALAGYRQIFADRGGAAPVARVALHTPRISINGFDTIELFAMKLGLMNEPPDEADLPLAAAGHRGETGNLS